MQYSRSVKELIQSRLGEKTPLIQVLIGPRQVGKTTAIQQVLQGRGLYESADSPVPLSANVIESWWKQALKTTDKILVIDEVQKISGWSEILKKLWDQSSEQNRPKVIVSGSAALGIEKNLKESLAGRYELLKAEHWNFEEAHRVFKVQIQDFIEFGCYPGSQKFRSDVIRWGEYIRDAIIEPAIGRDILQVHPIENPALMKQLFALCASMPAAIISLQKLVGQLQDSGAIATVQKYLELLQASFLVSPVMKYTQTPLRTRQSSPKIIIHDNALIRAVRRPMQSPLSAEEKGWYFENAVGARLIESGSDVYYWKERDYEVDFVIHTPQGEKLAIEVKSSSTSLKELCGLLEFCKKNPEFKPCLVSLVGQTFPQIHSLSVEQMLSLNRQSRF